TTFSLPSCTNFFSRNRLQDADVLWLRNPFSNFSPEADVELACDFFNGNETDIRNQDNTGHAKFYYHIHDQEVFDRIKLHAEFRAIGAKIRFTPTEVFSGFCEPASDMERVCTIHANCCQGLRSKLADLQLVQEDWNHFMRTRNRANRPKRFRAPRACLKGCFSAFTSKPCYRSCYNRSLNVDRVLILWKAGDETNSNWMPRAHPASSREWDHLPKGSTVLINIWQSDEIQNTGLTQKTVVLNAFQRTV
ncbi:uncharacterized protein At4g15970-like, partial [Selaginella moellendorffii]|uniref:uncharacterized protein At4g15970-like n=1 Tax=Selaginella moellendorffii TaxID=88036 RepID=UPI000D1C23C5